MHCGISYWTLFLLGLSDEAKRYGWAVCGRGWGPGEHLLVGQPKGVHLLRHGLEWRPGGRQLELRIQE